MGTLAGKNLLLGITGGIAAYKCGELIRRLKDEGADVRVVMTPAAQAFVQPMTFQALSGNPVHTQLLDPHAEAGMGHIELARWADQVLVAPVTASFMARLAAGDASDLLSTLCLATSAPISLAPAMNQQMWRAAATQRNLRQLEQSGYHILGPASGDQACGDNGPGRMLEPAELLALLGGEPSGELAGKQVLITAGPTLEAIDPVRYISNFSSGKMGFALAATCARAGASVTLVSGPVSLATPRGVNRIDVQSCQQMHDAVIGQKDIDIFIATAAVADYRPAARSAEKIKKSTDSLTIELVRNPDILADMSARSPRPGLVVGFAAESSDLAAQARAKMETKKLDLVVANLVNQPGGVFGSDENQVLLLDRLSQTELPRMEKRVLAEKLVQEIAKRL